MKPPPGTCSTVRSGSRWRGVITCTGKPASSSVTTEKRRSKNGTNRLGNEWSRVVCHASTRARSAGSESRSRDLRTLGTIRAARSWVRLGMGPSCPASEAR